MFSSRTPSNLSPNRLAQALRRMRADRCPFVDLTLSNPTRAGFDYPTTLLQPLGDPRGLVYDPEPLGVADARAAVAADYARRGLRIAPERIVLTASTSDAYSVLFRVLADPGDEILVPRPSYPLFEHLTRFDALVPRGYDLEYHGAWTIDIGSVERAITARTRALLVVSPNNPTGSFVTQAELDRLAEICAEAQVAIVADEVFADYVLASEAGRQAARIVDRRDALTFSLGGLSKSIGLPQVKLGWIGVAGPGEPVARALERLELVCDTYLSVSTIAQAAAVELLARGADLRAQITARVVRNHQALLDRAARTPACRVLNADGGWYAVVRVPATQPEEELVIHLLTSDGVLAHPGYFFDFPREAFLVVSLLVPPTDFDPAIDRLFRHFDCTDDPALGADAHTPHDIGPEPS